MYLFTMKRTYLLLIALCFAFQFTSCRKYAEQQIVLSPAEGELTLLAYNVAGLPEGISGSNPSIYTAKIGRLLNDYDIVHVQEDFNYNHFLYGPARHKYKTPWSGPAILGDGLNTLSIYPIKDFLRFRWNDCFGTDCLTPKGFSYSRIVVAPDLSIDFYNVHCNAGSGPDDLAARRKNIVQLCNYIDEHSAGNAVVIMGDFNCRYTRSGDTIRALLDRGFTDAWIKLARGGVIPELGSSSLTSCGGNPSSNNCEVVDKLLYRSSDKISLSALEYEMQEAKFSENGEWLSDHMPLFVRMKFAFTP
jgi:hypothetical protein